MPKVISANTHRFAGPNQYYSGPWGPASWPAYGAWVSPSPGILVIAFPVESGDGTGYRYNLMTNTVTSKYFNSGTFPILDPGGSNVLYRKPFFCSLGNGFALIGRIDTADGQHKAWIYSDLTQSYTAISLPSLSLSIGSPAPTFGAYPLGSNLAFLEFGTQAFRYNRITNTWTTLPTMPRQVWAGAQISEGLLYLAGRQDETKSAESFIYDNATNSYTNLGHSIELVVPPQQGIGGSSTVTTRSGQMARFTNAGVIGIGKNNQWITYRHDVQSLATRSRSQSPLFLELLRQEPISYQLNTLSGGFVYSY